MPRCAGTKWPDYLCSIARKIRLVPAGIAATTTAVSGFKVARKCEEQAERKRERRKYGQRERGNKWRTGSLYPLSEGTSVASRTIRIGSRPSALYLLWPFSGRKKSRGSFSSFAGGFVSRSNISPPLRCCCLSRPYSSSSFFSFLSVSRYPYFVH